jgi:hypothetical protein
MLQGRASFQSQSHEPPQKTFWVESFCLKRVSRDSDQASRDYI